MGISYCSFNSLSGRERFSVTEQRELYKQEEQMNAKLKHQLEQQEALEIKRLDYLITKTDFYKLIMDKLKGCQND